MTVVARTSVNRDPGSGLDVRSQFRLLEHLLSSGLKVPRPIALSPRMPGGQETAVLEFVEGSTVFSPDNIHDYLHKLVDCLIAVHRTSLPPEIAGLLGSAHSGSLHGKEAEVSSMISRRRGNSSVLLHGDYWPGNTIWAGDEIVAVIDWEDACFGDPQYDLSNTRLELLWFFGPEEMREFTERYSDSTGVNLELLPAYDLLVSLKTGRAMKSWDLERKLRKNFEAGLSEFKRAAADEVSAMRRSGRL